MTALSDADTADIKLVNKLEECTSDNEAQDAISQYQNELRKTKQCRPTLLATAIKCGTEKAAEFIVSLHDSDWQSEVHESKTILLFCLITNPPRWHGLAATIITKLIQLYTASSTSSSNSDHIKQNSNAATHNNLLQKFSPGHHSSVSTADAIESYVMETCEFKSFGRVIAIHVAAFYGLTDIIKDLLTLSISKNLLEIPTEKGQLIPLCFAINTQDTERRRSEQNNNKPRRQSNSSEVVLGNGKTAMQQVISAMHRAEQRNSQLMVTPTPAGKTFWELLDEQKCECVKFLLQQQSLKALKIETGYSMTVAQYAISTGSSSIVHAILEVADLPFQTGNQSEASKTYIQSMFLAAIEYNKVEYIGLLWSWLILINPERDTAFDNLLKSLVAQVIFFEQQEILEVLIRGCKVFTVDQKLDDDGNTMLITAMKYCCLDIVKWLLQQKANSKAENEQKQNLQLCILRELNEGNMRAEFLDLFAPTSLSDNSNMKYIVDLMNPDLTEALLRMAACESNYTMLSRMVETFNCNAALVTDENGNTLLHLAARSCVAELFQFLFKSENSFEHSEQVLHKQLSSINPLFTNSENKTFFHVACEAGTPEIVHLLLQIYSAEYLSKFLDIKDQSGNNILHCVAMNSKDSDIIFLSIECSGSMQLEDLKLRNRSSSVRYKEKYSHRLRRMTRDQNRDGNTPLHIAAQLQNAALIPYLDKSNPHLLNRPNDGLTPIHCALLTRNEQFFEAFLLQVKKFGKFSLSSLFKSNEGNFNQLPLLHFVAGLGMPKTMRLLVQNGSEFLLEFDRKRNTVLHHIARLMVRQTEKDAKLMLLQVVDEVVEAYAQATLDLTTFSATAVNALTARRYAMNYLTRKVLNKAGYSVLMYAAKKDAVEYVQHLLRAVQPEQQFDQLRNMKCPLLYDVSYLTPQSWRWMEKGGVTFLTSWSAHSSNADGCRFTQVSDSKDDGSYSDSDSDDNRVFKLPAKERMFDFLGVVLNSRKSDRVKQLLEQSPMPEMLQSFIGAYQWFHMLILLTHMMFMTVFTYYSVTFLDTINEAIEPKRFVDFVFGHKRNNGAFLVWPAVMCTSHLLISILKCLHWFGYCRCSKKQLHKEPNANSRRHNTINKKRGERLIDDIKLYALATVLVLVMCAIMFLYCISSAIWYVGVSNCIDELEFPFKILTIIFTVLCMLEVLLLMKLGIFDRILEFFPKQYFSFPKWAYISVATCFLVYLVIFCALAFTPHNDCTPTTIGDIGNNTDTLNISFVFSTLAPTFTKISEDFDNSSTVDTAQRRSTKYYAFILIFPVLICVIFFVWFTWKFMKFIVRSAKAVVGFVLNLIEMFTIYIHIVALYVFGALMLGWYASSYTQKNYQLYFLAAALLVGWTYTIHFTHGIRTMHVFNVVLKRIIYEDVIRFAILYGFIVVGFSCAMHVLFFNFEAQLNEQPSILDTIYMVIKISVGIGDVLDSNLDFNDTNYQTRSGWAGLKVLYIVFILIGNVILLNILIAMMSHRYEDIVSRETITWRYDYVSYIMKLPPFVRKVIERLGDGKKYQEKLYRESNKMLIRPAGVSEDGDVMLSMVIEAKNVIEKGKN